MSEVRCGLEGFTPVVVTPFGPLGGRVQPPRRGDVVGWKANEAMCFNHIATWAMCFNHIH